MNSCITAKNTKKLKYIFRLKISGGVLVYATVISIIILISLACFFQLFIISNGEKIKMMSEVKKEDILQSGIELFLAIKTSSQDTAFKVSLFENDQHEHLLKQEQYGLFDIITSTLIWGKDTLYKTVMVANCKRTDPTALKISPGLFALKLGGDALIEGDVEISPKGIERAYINNKSYNKDSLVYGNILLSSKPIPELQNNFLKLNCNNFTNLSLAENISIRNDSLIKINRSFNQKTLLISSNNEINLYLDSISGRCILKSAKVIKVNKYAYLENIILSAPKIIIEDDFEGCLQLIASDTIIIGKRVKLNYPSAIFVNANQKQNTYPLIRIEDNSNIQGLIIGIQNNSASQKQVISPVLVIEEKTEITGQVYSSGEVYLKGLIKGSLVCKQLIDLSSGVNESLLIDGKISKRKMPVCFPEFSITENNYQKTILKCLE